MGGYSVGEPTYMYRFALGGANQLNGYLDNRFRGREYYMQQTELRFPIWKLFSGVGSLGFGDITDTKFTNPKLAYGIGLRIGLPPDWVNKIRIDFAFGRDQAGIFANFGQTF
jgi:outer membrane protein assembly factor BamA